MKQSHLANVVVCLERDHRVSSILTVIRNSNKFKVKSTLAGPIEFIELPLKHNYYLIVALFLPDFYA